MKKKHVRMKNSAMTFYIVVLAFLLIFIGNKIFDQNDFYFTEDNNLTTIEAEVTEISDTNFNDDGSILFFCKMLNGEQKNKEVSAVQFSDAYFDAPVKLVEVGDKIYLGDATSYNVGVDWFLYDYERFHGVLWLGIAFAVLLLFFGQVKGFKTIISIMYTCATIFLVFLPAVLAGHNIYLCALTLCIFITVMSLLIVQGATTKCLSAVLGSLGGLFIVSGITVMMSGILKLTGLTSEDSLYLMQMDLPQPLDLKAVIFASIIIGAMGAVLDIAVDIVAALNELHNHAPHMTMSQTLKSGIVIGQDIVGSMSNTLILAYIGSSLSLILLVLVNSGSMTELLNSELIVVEILQALAGSIGILFTIPITSISFGLLYRKGKANHQQSIVSTNLKEDLTVNGGETE